MRFPHAQAVRQHRVEVHGDPWTTKGNSKKKETRKSKVVTELPTVPVKKARRSRSTKNDPLRQMAKVMLETDVMWEELRKRFRA